MKLVIIILLSSPTLFCQPGMIELFIAQQEAQIIYPKHTFLKGATILGATAFTVNEYKKQQKIAQSRSSLSSNLLFTTLGGALVLFLVHKFIGHEMGIIIETKNSLEKLTEQIIEWKKVIPQLQQNQHDLAAKIKKALTVLDTITPLVTKLSMSTATPINPDFIISMQNELDDLKELIGQIALAQLQAGANGLENNDSIAQKVAELDAFNERLFGK